MHIVIHPKRHMSTFPLCPASIEWRLMRYDKMIFLLCCRIVILRLDVVWIFFFRLWGIFKAWHVKDMHFFLKISISSNILTNPAVGIAYTISAWHHLYSVLSPKNPHYFDCCYNDWLDTATQLLKYHENWPSDCRVALISWTLCKDHHKALHLPTNNLTAPWIWHANQIVYI